jgi:TonB-dependent receptor
MRRILSSTFLFLACFCLIGTLSFAQSAKGSLSGRVADKADAVLQGAQVELLPRAGTATTDEQGEFNFTNLAPGTYTVMISYVGFEPFTQDVTITAGKNTQLRAVITISGKNEEVTVLSERQNGEVEAINRTRAAENILQVLPAEVIMSLPNANIADALGRMPSVTIERDEGEGKYVQIRGTEPFLTNVTVDGITIPSPESGNRQIKLDTIASDLVDSVEINKTLQANIDGDGIGGSVNLRTKTATETPTFALYGLGGYTPISTNGREVMQGGGTLGQRFGAQKKLGILVGGTYDYNGRGINDIEPVPTSDSLVPHYDSMDLRDYVYDRSRWGATASADYKLGEGSSVYVRGLFSTFRNWGHKWTYTLNDATSPNFSNKPSYSQDWRRPNMAIGNLVAGGKHVFSGSWFTWDAAVGRSRSLGGSGSAKYWWNNSPINSDAGPGCFNDQSVAASVYRPGWSSGCYGNSVNSNSYGLVKFTLPNAGQSVQLNLTGSAAFAKNYHVGSHFATFEFGGKLRNAHKFDDTYQESWSVPYVKVLDPATGSKAKVPANLIPVSAHPEWDSNFTDSNYYDKTYSIGPVTDYSKVRSWVLANPSMLPVYSGPGPNSNNFDYIERISAGYIMNTIDLTARLRMVLGVRFEATHFDGLTFDPNASTVSQKVAYDYLDALPSASLRFAVDKDSNLRLAYGRGVARPQPSDLVQASSPLDTSSTPAVVSIANPKLTAEYADNVDLLYERYLKPSGLLQIGFFYKHISNPIVNGQYLDPNFPGADPGQPTLVSEVQNVGSANLYGFEIGYQQRLTFLPKALHGLGLSANYSYTNSQVNNLLNLQRTDSPALQRQAPNTWNISPTFDTRNFSLRIGMTYNDAMIYAYQFKNLDNSTGVNLPVDPATIPGGTKGPSGDNYLYSHYQIDVQGSYKLPYGLQVYAYGLNLNNEVFGFYNGSPQYVVQREYYKPTYAGGIRYNFTREK